jgi:ABC-type lipoprotein release transport system permease subunit
MVAWIVVSSTSVAAITLPSWWSYQRATAETSPVRSTTIAKTLLGLFGIVKYLAPSVLERVRELGLLRAIGMDHRQVRAMLRRS